MKIWTLGQRIYFLNKKKISTGGKTLTVRLLDEEITQALQDEQEHYIDTYYEGQVLLSFQTSALFKLFINVLLTHSHTHCL